MQSSGVMHSPSSQAPESQSLFVQHDVSDMQSPLHSLPSSHLQFPFEQVCPAGQFTSAHGSIVSGAGVASTIGIYSEVGVDLNSGSHATSKIRNKIKRYLPTI